MMMIWGLMFSDVGLTYEGKHLEHRTCFAVITVPVNHSFGRELDGNQPWLGLEL